MVITIIFAQCITMAEMIFADSFLLLYGSAITDRNLAVDLDG